MAAVAAVTVRGDGACGAAAAEAVTVVIPVRRGAHGATAAAETAAAVVSLREGEKGAGDAAEGVAVEIPAGVHMPSSVAAVAVVIPAGKGEPCVIAAAAAIPVAGGASDAAKVVAAAVLVGSNGVEPEGTCAPSPTRALETILVGADALCATPTAKSEAEVISVGRDAPPGLLAILPIPVGGSEVKSVGRAASGAPEVAQGQAAVDATSMGVSTDDGSYLRVSLLVNLWAGHKPVSYHALKRTT
jgi:hypothetical protein